MPSCRTAVTVANAQQSSEIAGLKSVITLANETLVDLVNATIAANYTLQLTNLATTYASEPSNVSTVFAACPCTGLYMSVNFKAAGTFS